MTTKNLMDFKQILNHVRYDKPAWDIEVHEYGISFYLQVVFIEKGEEHKGRKWQLSRHMTETEIVRTAYKAILAAEEHEAAERFKYCGYAIYSPHMHIEGLLGNCKYLSMDERKKP